MTGTGTQGDAVTPCLGVAIVVAVLTANPLASDMMNTVRLPAVSGGLVGLVYATHKAKSTGMSRRRCC